MTPTRSQFPEPLIQAVNKVLSNVVAVAVETVLTGAASWDFSRKRMISYQSHDAWAGW
jgi:hypothetical protein